MRRITYSFEGSRSGSNINGEMEFDDDVSDADIEEAVREEFFNHFNYGWSDVEGAGAAEGGA